MIVVSGPRDRRTVLGRRSVTPHWHMPVSRRSTRVVLRQIGVFLLEWGIRVFESTPRGAS